MTYKEKLIELLKEVLEIKSDLEELKFWCKCKYKHSPDWWRSKWVYIWENSRFSTDLFRYNSNWNVVDISDKKEWWKWFEVIWNPLEEHHLRMYCEKKWIEIFIDFEWKVYSFKKELLEPYTLLFKLDNTKSFDNQSEEVYEKIFNYLKQI